LQSDGGNRRDRLLARIATERVDELALPIAAVEEQMRGWLATVARERQVARQVKAYRELEELMDFFVDYVILPFDNAAAAHFDRLRPLCRRVTTSDLKIACCAIAADATLLTANRRDFIQIPGLRFENWLD
jgi:tRNA(fMet)-specific endonuclease VapC